MPSRGGFRGLVVLAMLTTGTMAAVAADPTAPVTPDESEPMLITDDVTGERYRLDVSIPEAPPPPGGYPVLYVLDGNARFGLLREARDTLSRSTGDDQGLPLVIVGVGYPGVSRFDVERRQRDYTPSASTVVAGTGNAGGVEEKAAEVRQQATSDVAGHAPQFLRFLTGQLMPWVEQRLETDSRRQALLGHSLGGLFALYVQQRCPDCYDSLFAISPSLWWNDASLGQQLAGHIDDRQWCARLSDRLLFIGVGEREQSAEEPDGRRASLRRERAMVDRARDYQARLSRGCPGLESEFRVFPDEHHGSVMWPAARLVIERLAQRYGD